MKPLEFAQQLLQETGVSQAWSAWLGRSMPGGPSFGKSLGAVVTYLFLLQLVVGVALALHYSPSITQAWASTAYIQDTVDGGWFLRGIHHHGMSALIVFTLLHAIRAIWIGAYRPPRAVLWTSGLILGFMLLGFAFTGYLLTLDQNAYWAAQVRLGIAQGVPFGGIINTILIGGSEIGNLSITRAYVAHCVVLPAGCLALIFVHIRGVIRHGTYASGKIAEQAVDARAPFRQNVRDILAVTLVAAGLVVASVATHGSPLWGPADPNSTFVARPEWYFLPLYQLLHLLTGGWQIVGSAILPGAIAAYLFGLPVLSASALGAARVRGLTRLLTAACICGAVVLSGMAIQADAEDEDFHKAIRAQEKKANEARAFAMEGVIAQGGVAVFENDPLFRVRSLFAEHCETCHMIDEIGGEDGPRLDNYGSREWLAGLIRNPADNRYFGKTKHRDMDAYPEDTIDDSKLEALVEYVLSLRGEAGDRVDAQLASRGVAVFEDQSCGDCHEVELGKAGDAPTLAGHASVAWIQRLLVNPEEAELYGDSAEMPAFGKKLVPTDIELLANYVASLRAPAP